MLKHMLDAEYFAIDAVSNSYLSRFERCPAAAVIEIEPTANMVLGSAAHCLILEGREEFQKRFAVLPECDRRTKEGKEIYRSFCEENAGKTIVTLDQLQTISGMAESVANHPSARDLLANGTPEMAFTWEHDGLQMKGKADWLSPSALVDLKTCQNSDSRVFARTVVNSGYHRQMAMYRDGLAHNFCHPDNAFIIAVENTAPYACEVFRVTEELLELGMGSFRYLVKKYKECLANGQFPAYRNAGVVELFPPAWMSQE